MPLDKKLLDIIACPICKGKLHYDKNAELLVCKFHKFSFPIKNGVPVLLVDEAKPLEQNNSNSRTSEER